MAGGKRRKEATHRVQLRKLCDEARHVLGPHFPEACAGQAGFEIVISLERALIAVTNIDYDTHYHDYREIERYEALLRQQITEGTVAWGVMEGGYNAVILRPRSAR